MNKKRFSFKSSLMMISLAGLFVFGFTSCADDITQGQTVKENGTSGTNGTLTTSEGTGERITFAETEIGFNDTGLTDGMTRAITMYDVKTKKPNINLQDLVNRGPNSTYVIVALRKSGMTDNQVSYFIGKATVKHIPGKGYRVNLGKMMGNLREGGWSDDYYVQYSLSDATPRLVRVNNYNTFVFDRKDINENGMVYPTGDYNADGQRRDAQIKGMVWATRWVKPIKNSKGELTLPSQTSPMNFFNPQGILIKVSGTNKTPHKLTLKGVEIKTNGLAVCGTFEPGKVNPGDENNFGATAKEILFTPSVSTNAIPTDSEIKEGYLSSDKILRLKYDLANPNAGPGNKYAVVAPNTEMRPYYIWAYPIVKDRSDEMNKYMEFTYKYGPEGGATATMPKTVLSSKNFGNQFWFKNNLTYDLSGVGYKAPNELMITEFYHYNRQGYNCTMIEISNPTGKEIDLRDYRIARLRRFTQDNGPGLHFSDNYNFNHAEEIRNISVQPLWLNPDVPSGREKGKNLMGGDQFPLQYVFIYGTENAAKGPKGYMLAPGQSIVLCAYFIGQAAMDANNKYLPDEPDNEFGFTPRQISNNIAKGKLKYIVSVRNCYVLSTMGDPVFTRDRTIEEQHHIGSSTMTHGTKQALILLNVKKKSKFMDGSEMPFKIIDATAPCVDYLLDEPIDNKPVWAGQAAKYNTFLSVFKLDTFAGSSDRDDYDLIRRNHVIFPSVRFNYELTTDNEMQKDADWDLYVNKTDRTAGIPQAGTKDERGPKHNWGSAFE